MTPPSDTPADATATPLSPNFAFLACHDPLLVRYAAFAERYVFDDPNSAFVKLRQFAEVMAQRACAHVGVAVTHQDEFHRVLGMLRDRRVADAGVLDLFHALRKAGNSAVHAHHDDRAEALHLLRTARNLAVWFHRAFGDPEFRAGPFVPPPDPAKAGKALTEELHRLRALVVEFEGQARQAAVGTDEEAEARRRAEREAREAYEQLSAALALAEESEGRLAAERADYEVRLATLSRQAAQRPAEMLAAVERARRAATRLDLDEAQTRRLIDQQLRDAGWEADTAALNHRLGTRPQKGRDIAIAEWPAGGAARADYVLFRGLTPVAAVEAKKAVASAAGAVDQAKRYAQDYRPGDGEGPPGGPWGEFRLPFCFGTNGRPFLEQLKQESGVWFLDARRPTNLARPLNGWYTPAGLDELLRQDIGAADESLKAEPTEPLPLRPYQREAVAAVERALGEGRRALLVAMATGTGKTRTCIGLIYRLVKAGRFRRVLFLVDRTALGEQTGDVLKELKLDGPRAFTDIYAVAGLDDTAPEADTRLHIATVQGMVKRLLFPADDTPAVPVDAYDLVVVDECHRGYALDRELGEDELSFRDEADYVSKYRRVLDHFDAVKVGLTATPALHTTQIFGEPVYSYGYRQAVIDGHLADHEPPVRFVTQLAEAGIRWQAGEQIDTFLPGSESLDPVTAPDEVRVEVEGFNRKVVTENFNRVICAALAEQIDPSEPGKTIVFCVDDRHADLVVAKLKEAFEARYGSVEDAAVVKITAEADRPLKLIRRLKNERLPSVAVTVDLLSTGIDVPAVTNIVFLRRVRSRILYEQMLGRATRLCRDLYGPGLDKEGFRIYDAVDLYAALEPHSAMRPVVASQSVTFTQLAGELEAVTDPAAARVVCEQFTTKLQRKRGQLTGANAERFEEVAGEDVPSVFGRLRTSSPDEVRAWLAERPALPLLLDAVGPLDPRRRFVSHHADKLLRTETGYGPGNRRPADYLEAFRAFVTKNRDRVPALAVVLTRPRDLTRQQLRELRLALDEAGYTEPMLQSAWRDTTNEDIVAGIIGHVRHVAAGEPLLPYHDRVEQALKRLLASRAWTPPQRRWLERIGRQMEAETVVDRDALDRGQFREQGGGFDRLNRVFEGRLEGLLVELAEAVWTAA